MRVCRDPSKAGILRNNYFVTVEATTNAIEWFIRIRTRVRRFITIIPSVITADDLSQSHYAHPSGHETVESILNFINARLSRIRSLVTEQPRNISFIHSSMGEKLITGCSKNFLVHRVRIYPRRRLLNPRGWKPLFTNFRRKFTNVKDSRALWKSEWNFRSLTVVDCGLSPGNEEESVLPSDYSCMRTLEIEMKNASDKSLHRVEPWSIIVTEDD